MFVSIREKKERKERHVALIFFFLLEGKWREMKNVFEKLISYSMKILMEKEYSNVILTEN